MLEQDQIIRTVQNPKNREQIQEGRDYESELRLYTEPKNFDDLRQEKSWQDYRNSIATRISSDKRDNIEDYIVAPLAVTAVTGKLASDLCRVFSSQDKHFEVETVKGAGGDKINRSLKFSNIQAWIEENGSEVIVNKPCSIVVVDRDKTGLAYPVLIDSERIVDFELNADKKTFKYITFIHSESYNDQGEKELRYSVYDDTHYYVVLKIKDNYYIERDEPHNIGYCPAKFFVDKPLNSNSDYKRKNRFYLAHSKLEQWQTISTFKYYSEHHVPFPTVEMVEERCSNPVCEGGYVSKEIPSGDSYQTVRLECPECKGKLNNLKLGSMILIQPQGDNDDPTSAGKFKMHYPDVSCLEFLNKDLSEIEAFINDKVLGSSVETNKTAINEDQVNSGIESKKNVYLELKRNIDGLYVWIAETIAFASAKNSIVNVFADWGTEWYLFSEDDLLERYEKAKEAGLPRSELDSLFLEYISTKYKGDNKKSEREKIIFLLNPDPHSLLDNKIKKLEKGLMTKEDFVLSESITDYVKKFEAEKAKITDFGSELDINLRVERIKEELIKIVTKYLQNVKPETTG